MTSITTREFRSNMASMFNKVDAGEQVLVRRNNRMYTIVPVQDNELAISPKLWARIEEGRKQIANGDCIVCNNEEELKTYFEAL